MAKLPPGHMLTVAPGEKPRVIAYWDLAFSPDRSIPEEEWVSHVRGQLEATVSRQLVSDVPLGMFLSGGIDSSAIVAMVARATGRRLQTFSVGFEEASYDERGFARLVAERYETNHTEVIFAPRDALALMNDVGDLLDEPLVDGPFLPIYVFSREARRAVTVVLSGDGGDVLCGYPTFLAERGAQWVGGWPQWAQRAATRAVNGLPASPRYGSVEFLLKQFFRGLPHAVPTAPAGLRRAGLEADGRRGRGTCGGGAAAEGVDVDYPRGRDDIVLFGRLPREQALATAANFDLALYPRTKDQGIQAAKVGEFIGLGVPTVSYDYKVTENLRETGAGVLVPTPREFVDAVVRLGEDDAARNEIAAAARRAGKELDWDVLAKRYEEEILDRWLPAGAPG
jgi:hypothetical protein